MDQDDRSANVRRINWFITVYLVGSMVAVTLLGLVNEFRIGEEVNDQKLLFLCMNPEVSAGDIEAILNAGADVDARDHRGRTPLMKTAWYNENPEVIEALLKAGADVNARDVYGLTPLMLAAQNTEDPKVLELLLKAGVDAKAKDKDGKTAADHAKDNEKIYKTKVYLKLIVAEYE